MRFQRVIRAVSLGAAIALGATQFAAAQAMPELTPAQKALYEKAKAEGELTWSTSQHNSQFAQKIADKFTSMFPGVKVNVLRTTGQVQFQRLNQEIRAGTIQADAYSNYAEAHLVELAKHGQLATFQPENFAKLVPAITEMGRKDMWWPTSLAPVALGYNTNLVKESEAPDSWHALHDPKWKGQAAIGHPGFSGSVGLWCMAMERTFGWEFFDKLAKNDPQIGRSIVDGYNLILSGERKIALVPTALTDEAAQKGSPVKTVHPKEGTLLAVGPTAILKAAPHPNAARLFVEFLFTKEYSEMLSQDQRLPLRPEVAAPKGVVPLSELKIITVPIEYQMENLQKVKEKFRDTFGI